MKTMKRLWNSINDQHGRLIVVMISVVIYTFLTIFAPLYSATIIDLIWNNIKEAFASGTIFQVTWQSGGKEIFYLLLIYVATALLYALQSYLKADFAEKLNLRLRTEIAEKLNRLPLAYFERTKTGAILSRVVTDLDKTSEALQTGALSFITSVGSVIGSIIMMFTFSGSLTFIFLLFTVGSLIATKFVSEKTLEYAMKRQEDTSRVTAKVEEAYSGRIIIKSFNQEANSSKELHEATEALAESTEKAEFIMNAINPAIRLINRFGQVVIAVLAGKMLSESRLTVGTFQAFFQYVNQASEPVTQAAYMINSMQSALASLERIYDMLDEEELTPEPNQPNQIDAIKGAMEFKHIKFGYTPDRILMNDINFSVKPGQKVAIVGSIGAGKTTLINLIMRFYELNGGQILLDGVDTKSMTRSELRSHIGMVLQDTWLFGGTIAENIAYSKPDATREEIIQAAKAASVDFFVRTMPDGYDTVLSNDAENISVGQRQLLTIARVFLLNPSLIILDEATSSVDTRTEIEISNAMKALMQGRTSFVIAHRLSTITDADLILVMENGTIIEQGNHDTLLEKGDAYADLYYSQFA